MEKVIIDTDPAIGVPLKDVDDGLAIAFALQSPELDVIGITLTYGNTSLRKAYRSAVRTLKAAGREDIPLLRGASSPRELGQKSEASDFIIDSINKNPGNVSILTLGPVTNLATVEQLAPGTLQKAGRTVAMGGAVFGRGIMPPLFRAEFNFWNDPPASAIFLKSARDLTLVPCELTMKVAFRRKYLKRLRDAGTSLSGYIYRDSLLWYAVMSLALMRDGFPPHDPLAVGWMLRPDLFSSETATIKMIERGPLRGETRRSRHGVQVNVTTEVNEECFLDLLTERLCSDIRNQ